MYVGKLGFKIKRKINNECICTTETDSKTYRPFVSTDDGSNDDFNQVV